MKNSQNHTSTANKRKSRIITSIVITLAVIISFVCGYFFNTLIQGKARRNLNSVLDLIENKGIFVTLNDNGEELTDDELLKLIVDTLLNEDEYARYYSKEEYSALKQQNQGSYSGYGINFLTGSTTIYSVTGNSPAEYAGLREGDVLVSAKVGENQPTEFADYLAMNEFFNQNAQASEMVFNVMRLGEIKSFTVVKSDYVASYIKYFDSTEAYNFYTSNNKKAERRAYVSTEQYNLPQDTVLIKISEFMGDADIQFGSAIEYMKEQGKTKLILDLRGNGGGKMDVLCKIAGYLIYNGGKSSSPIVYSYGKKSSETFHATFNKYYTDLRQTVVLCDENTASASECLIGAMLYYGQEEKDGNFPIDNLVVCKNSQGEARTYGKGIMQTTYELYSGEAVKFTTAKIYQPDNVTCIHGVGLRPSNELNAVDKSEAVKRALEILN